MLNRLSLLLFTNNINAIFPPFAHPVLKTFVMCEPLSGEFQPNSETVQSSYFALSELPPMNEEKNTPAQVELCFQAHHSSHWTTQFD